MYFNSHLSSQSIPAAKLEQTEVSAVADDVVFPARVASGEFQHSHCAALGTVLSKIDRTERTVALVKFIIDAAGRENDAFRFSENVFFLGVVKGDTEYHLADILGNLFKIGINRLVGAVCHAAAVVAAEQQRIVDRRVIVVENKVLVTPNKVFFVQQECRKV